MKLLLDENLPHSLIRHFPLSYTVDTVQGNNWHSTENGALIRTAAAAGYDALLTGDTGIRHQHNLHHLPLPVITYIGWANNVQRLIAVMPEVLHLLSSPLANRIYTVDTGTP